MTKTETSIKIFKVVLVYQIIIWLITLFFFLKLIFNLVFEKASSFLILIQMLAIICSLFYLYLNLALFLGWKKKVFEKFLNINIWFNFIQAIQLYIFGFKLYFSFGVYILLYFSYDEIMKFAMTHSLFEASFGVNLAIEDNFIKVGINIIPLIIFIILSRVKKDIITKNEYSLTKDLDITKNANFEYQHLFKRYRKRQ